MWVIKRRFLRTQNTTTDASNEFSHDGQWCTSVPSTQAPQKSDPSTTVRTTNCRQVPEANDICIFQP